MQLRARLCCKRARLGNSYVSFFFFKKKCRVLWVAPQNKIETINQPFCAMASSCLSISRAVFGIEDAVRPRLSDSVPDRSRDAPLSLVSEKKIRPRHKHTKTATQKETTNSSSEDDRAGSLWPLMLPRRPRRKFLQVAKSFFACPPFTHFFIKKKN